MKKKYYGMGWKKMTEKTGGNKINFEMSKTMPKIVKKKSNGKERKKNMYRMQ